MKEKNKSKKEKIEKNNKFIEIIKKKWIINTSKTLLLVFIIFACFIGITILMKKLDFTPIDLTEEKLFTITQESKEQVKNIDKDINIYFIGCSDEDSILDLAKEYAKVNNKINVEAVTSVERPDLSQKYGLESDSEGIIIESGNRYKVLAASDLYTYDYETYETVNIAEEKLTAAIKSVSVEELPKVYFLSGYSEISLSKGMQYLNMYLQNEVNDVQILDILSVGKVPDDCKTLVITSPEKDFDDIATNAIIDYINNGGNILWLNEALAQKIELTNVNKILAIYGINPFEVGIIRETNIDVMVSGSPDLIMPHIEYTDVTNKLYNSEGVIFVNATKINVVDEESLENLGVKETVLAHTSSGSYFRSNFEINSDAPVEGEVQTEYVVGAEFEKDISEGKKSKLIIYGENYFVTDYQLTQTSQTPMIVYRQNKDLVLNSIAYLSDREEDITIRKGTGSVTYRATEQENRIILSIIIAVPLIIIVIGIIVWIKRKRQK